MPRASRSLLIYATQQGEEDEEEPATTPHVSFYKPLPNHSQASLSPPTIITTSFNGPHSRSPNLAESNSIAALSASFPLSTNSFQSVQVDMEYLLVHHLPQWEEAWKLSQLYLEQAPWFFGAVTKKHLMEEILPMWYHEARDVSGATSPPASTPASSVPVTPISPIDAATAAAASPESTMSSASSSSTTHLKSPNPNKEPTRTAHDLSLLFMIFCFGALTDVSLPPAPENILSEQFFQLTKASLVLEPVLERPPSVATVQTLSLMAIYEGICSREGSIERTWSLFGLAGKLAQSIGLRE